MSCFEWHYGVVLHKPDDESISQIDRFASIGEIYTIDDKSVTWNEVQLTYFESIDELKKNLRMLLDDIENYEPINYPDDFYPELMSEL